MVVSRCQRNWREGIHFHRGRRERPHSEKRKLLSYVVWSTRCCERAAFSSSGHHTTVSIPFSNEKRFRKRQGSARRLDGDGLDVLPALLDEGDQEVDHRSMCATSWSSISLTLPTATPMSWHHMATSRSQAQRASTAIKIDKLPTVILE